MLTEGHEAGKIEASMAPHDQPALIAQNPPLASWGSRAKALALDWLMLVVPAVLLFLVLVVPELGNTPTPDSETDFALLGALVMFLALMLLVGIGWALLVVLMMIRKGERNGQTWGKQIVGIRAVRDNGEPWKFGSAAARGRAETDHRAGPPFAGNPNHPRAGEPPLAPLGRPKSSAARHGHLKPRRAHRV
jgi:uncharacterized RDD family membrane protein YckC